MFLRLPILSVLLAFSVLAFGDSSGFDRCDGTVSQFRDFRDLIVPIAEFTDSPTHRQTTEEYAATHKLEKKVVDDATAATGELDCNGAKGSANLVSLDGKGKSNVIATVAHALYDEKTCRKTAEATDCKFISSPGAKPIKVIRQVDTGFVRCPHDGGEDWSVMKLESAVDGIAPYKLPTAERSTLKFGQNVVAVAAQSMDFSRTDPRTGKRIFPKHLQDCDVHIIYYKYNPQEVTERCDGSYGNSGGALIDDLNNRELLAVVSRFYGSDHFTKEFRKELETNIPFHVEYNETEASQGSTAVSGRFLEALRTALK